MANEVLRFDILIGRNDADSGFSATGRAASEAAGNVDKLTARLVEVSRKSATARVNLAGDKEALAELDRTDAKLLGLDRRVASPRLKVDGAARALADISAVDIALDKLGKKASDSGSGGGFSRLGAIFGGGSGGGSGGGMGPAAVLPAAAGVVNPYTIAAGAAATPFLGQIGAGGIAAGFGTALAGLAILGASKTKEIQGDFTSLKTSAMADLAQIGKPFVPVMDSILKTATSTMNKLTPVFKGAERVIAGPFKEFGDTLAKSFNQPAVRTSIDAVAVAFGKILKALSPQLPGMIKSVADGITHIADAVAKNPKPFADFINFLVHTVGFALNMIAALTRVASYIEKHWVPVFDGARHEIAHVWDQIYGNTIGTAIRIGQKVEASFNSTRSGISGILTGIQHDAITRWNLIWDNTVGRTVRGVHDIGAWFSALSRDIAGKLNGLRADAASIWNSAWNNTVARAASGVSGVFSWLTAMRSGHSSRLSGLRADAAGTWNAIWNSTVSRTASGVSGVLSWVGTLPGRITSIFRGAGSWLYNVGVWVIQGLWNGAKSQVGGITSFFSSFASGIVGVFKKIWGWFSPSSVMYEGGKSLMQGLMGGIKDHAHQAVAAATAAATKVAAASGSAAAAQRYAAGMLGRFGWGQAQMGPLISLWNQESGWNANAVNPSSGAYGIPQALPAAQGHPYNLGDYANQIMWGLNYIKGRYGSPAAAWAHEKAFNWYGAGTLSAAPGWAVVGEHGPELMHFRGGEQVVPSGPGRGGSTYVINVSPSPLARPADIGREVVGWIRSFEKGAGKGWRS